MKNEVKENELYFARANETVVIPTKKSHNAGYDVYANFEENYMTIEPHETKMIPTGLYSACSEDYYIQLTERGSTGTKGIGQRCGVIDSSYRGEWFVPITNHNNYPIIIIKKFFLELIKDYQLLNTQKFNEKYGEITRFVTEDVEYYRHQIVQGRNIVLYPYEKAICQAVVVPVPKMNVKEITVEKLKNIPSERGEGCLGSSQK